MENKKVPQIAIIGGGHAGCEAALAAARMGVSTFLWTMNLDQIANMPCNPSIGGTAKGHLVRELDALGGEMGKVADATFIQSRMLGTSKGAAVYSLRVQADRKKYAEEMKKRLENEPNLHIVQGEVVAIRRGDLRSPSWILKTRFGEEYEYDAVVLATGTFLGGKIIVGDSSYAGGPDGSLSATELGQSIKDLGLEIKRFKTGTPPRVHKRSIDFSVLEEQIGDDEITPFSFETTEKLENQVSCWTAYTNEKTHEIIRENLHRSPLYNGTVEGVGPRYCPSIEDKVVRFADKERHQLFLEPMGLSTDEYYIQGFSSSLPCDVQEQMLHSINGLENAEIMRYAYAIEYDIIDPTQLKHSLEYKDYAGLFGAGQVNGTSGYEEAAVQGLIAGINAALFVKNADYHRSSLQTDGAIPNGGETTNVDDAGADAHICPQTAQSPLVGAEYLPPAKGTQHPETETLENSTALSIRRDDLWSSAKGTNSPQPQPIPALCLTRDEAYIGVLIDDLITKGVTEPYRMMTARAEFRLLLRQETADRRLTPIGYKIGLISQERYNKFTEKIKKIDEEIEILKENKDADVSFEAQTAVQYEGYIDKHKAQINQLRRMESTKIPADIDYLSIEGLRIEARQRLQKSRPETLGQASRLEGVNPADLAVLMVILKNKPLRGT